MPTPTIESNAHRPETLPPDQPFHGIDRARRASMIGKATSKGSFSRLLLLIIVCWGISLGAVVLLIMFNTSVAATDMSQPNKISVSPAFDNSLQDNISRETGTYTLDNFWRLHGGTR